MRHNAILRRHTCPRLSGFCKMSSWSLDWKAAQKKADRTARWAVTMSKVRIRRVLSRTRWWESWRRIHGRRGPFGCPQGPWHAHGRYQTRGRSPDHSDPGQGRQCGNADDRDGMRLRAVAKRLHARHILLATWRNRSAARFFSYRPRRTKAQGTLDLAWYREAGLGGNGRGCQVAEVWLIKK